MEPYHRASEALRSGEEYPLNLLKNVGLTALGGGAATVGSKALGKILPAVAALINKYVPENISKAGLNKIDPRFGKFIDGSMQEEYTYDDVRNFLGEKVENSMAKENRNIIEQYSPELHQFIQDQIQSGRSPVEAGAVAKVDTKRGKDFNNVIKKMEKDHKTDWFNILQTVYGQGQQPEKQQGTQQPQPGQQQPQQGQGGIDPQLAQMMQQGEQFFQKYRGR